MAAGQLCVIICGVPAGTLSKDTNGLLSFTYRKDYKGPRLSSRMPVGGAQFGNKLIVPYLAGLLPDDEEQRKALAREHGISANDYFSLLEVIGLDCPGAVQFCRADADSTASALSRSGVYMPLSEHDIANRLRSIRHEDEETWTIPGEHWSLGGQQGKFALALHDGQWCSCQGAAPTSHIFKNGIRGMKLEALDEYVCMKAAKYCEVPVADVSYRRFEDQPALIVARYDRIPTSDGYARIHQEDMCQALGCMPERKYAAEGGPSAHDIVRLLASLGNVRANLRTFTSILFYNSLIWGTDAHAKNYSLLIMPSDGFMLAPMYDAASALPYFTEHDKGKLAMSIGGKNQYGRVSAGAVRRYAGSNMRDIAEIFDSADMGGDMCIDMMATLAERVPAAIERVFDESASLVGADVLRERMLGPIRENCANVLALL